MFYFFYRYLDSSKVNFCIHKSVFKKKIIRKTTALHPLKILEKEKLSIIMPNFFWNVGGKELIYWP